MQELTFTRDWRKNDTAARGGFPTDVYDEETVRADMQALHEETRAYLNGTVISSSFLPEDQQTRRTE